MFPYWAVPSSPSHMHWVWIKKPKQYCKAHIKLPGSRLLHSSCLYGVLLSERVSRCNGCERSDKAPKSLTHTLEDLLWPQSYEKKKKTMSCTDCKAFIIFMLHFRSSLPSESFCSFTPCVTHMLCVVMSIINSQMLLSCPQSLQKKLSVANFVHYSWFVHLKA